MSEITNDEPKGLSETDVGHVAARLGELGLNAPTGICILPSNFFFAENRNDLFVPPCAPDIKALLRQAGVTLDKIEPEGVKIPFRDDRDSTLILPVLFLGAAYLSSNPNLLNVALGVVANYVTDYFRGKAGRSRVRCCVVVETTDKKTTKKIDYDGSPEEFGKIIDAINKTVK